MSGGANVYVAVPAALAAAASFGLTGVLQHRATRHVPWRGALQPSLIVDLIRQPMWLASIIANVAGIALQVVALDYGPLVLIQPLLVTGLLFAVLFGAAMARHRPDRTMLLGAGACMAGLTAFLAVARPSGGSGRLTLDEVLPLAAGLAAILAICVSVASKKSGEVRVLALALAAGVLYGITAGLIKVVVGQMNSGGFFAPFVDWTLYAVCVVGPVGFLLNQNAYQAEAVAAPALAVITTVDPLIGIGIGQMWLGENIHTGLVPVVGEVVALIVMAAGITALSHRAPHLRREAVPAPPQADPGWRGGPSRSLRHR
ncbi:MAG: DMT family transporter [Streptosporangiaceae bacterium]